MIRLSKDRVLEDFYIDDNGVITNKEGEVQKFNLQQNRLRFKGVQVHKIQMWTKYGWRDGHIWAIHHVDENPYNNALKNLVYLTRSDHNSLHKIGNNGHKGQKWFNDGVKEHLIFPEDALPHYQEGRLICKK